MLSIAFGFFGLILCIPTLASLGKHTIPSTFSAYMFGTAVFYVAPYFTRKIAVYTASSAGYAISYLSLTCYVGIVFVVYVFASGWINKATVGRNRVVFPWLGRSWVKITLILTGPLLILAYIAIQAKPLTLAYAFFTLGNDAIRQYLSLVGPFVIFLYPLSGAFAYVITHISCFRINPVARMLLVTSWIVTVFLTGERHMILVMFGMVAFLAYKKRRYAAMYVVFSLMILFFLGYTQLFKTSARSVLPEVGLTKYVWTYSIDRLWALGWLVDHGKIGPVHSGLMPVLEGWKHALLAYIPRSLFPQKGYDTTQYLALGAAPYIGVDPGGTVVSEIGWGVAVGGAVEAAANLGWAGLVIEASFWGLGISLVSHWIKRTNDMALRSMMFFITVLATQTTLFTQFTLFLSTVIGYWIMAYQTNNLQAQQKQLQDN